MDSKPTKKKLDYDLSRQWTKVLREANKATSACCCWVCPDKKAFGNEEELWRHFRNLHSTQTVEDDETAFKHFREHRLHYMQRSEEAQRVRMSVREDGMSEIARQSRHHISPKRNPIQSVSSLQSLSNMDTGRGIVVQQRGLKMMINDRKESAFGDTGAGQNVISDRRRDELGLKMLAQPTSFPMGNSKRIFSPGVVKVPVAFEDDPTNIITIIAHVVHEFAYDLLLGNQFLKATKCLTTFMRRFVPCEFFLKSRWSFNLLGETTHRFIGQLGTGVAVAALPDIGSSRNFMNASWAMDKAKAGDFEMLTGPDNCGWVLLPDGTEEATVGQVRTTTTLSDGKIVPMLFELLPDCYVPVVFGQDFVFDHDIYTRYSSSLTGYESMDSGDELMPMGFISSKYDSRKRSRVGDAHDRNVSILSLRSLKRLFQPKSSPFYGQNTSEEELTPIPVGSHNGDHERQLDWNLKYQHGRTASIQEWNQENVRRENYELAQDPLWKPGISLIQHKPNALQKASAVRHINTSSSAPSEELALRFSASSTSDSPTVLGDSAGSSSGGTQNQDDLVSKWDSFDLGDFGRDEAAQWQEGLLN